MKKVVILLALFLNYALIGADNNSSDEITARAYLEDAIELIREKALYSGNIDWENTIPRAMGFLEFATKPEDTYPIIREILQQLEDGHSFFRTPARYEQNKYKKVEENEPVASKLIEKEFGYLKIPGLQGYTDSENLRHAKIIQTEIARLDSFDLSGWIVDLRENSGGNMWPMMAGLGPLLGEGTLGYMKMKEAEYRWSYEKDAVMMDSLRLISLPDSGYKLKKSSLPIAVLIGERTMSAGEAVAIAFRKNSNVRSFGQPTRGLTTVTVSHKLADGAQIVLTEGIYKDAKGNSYGGKIEPDVLINKPTKILNKAISWLRSFE